MSEYTPTDEDVRYVYVANCTTSSCVADHDEEFDRWQEKHDRQVAAGTLTGVAQAYFANGGTRTAAELLEIAKRIGAGEGG